MTPERWQKVEELFHAALELRAEERAAFLNKSCVGDRSLMKEIEALLSSDAQDENTMELLPSMVAAGWTAQRQNRKLVGQVIGRYAIVDHLESGGMGEVYLAEDSTLGRKVAIKVLPHHFTKDQERVRRFEQEARAASALNHPNIITIYEIGRWKETRFIATEFIEGQTLRQWMASRPLPIREVLDVGIQIASALEAAHAAGIVHRDIKPANVMVRRDGYVKVLDFGLAKLTARSRSESDQRAPLTMADLTHPGRVMGTINYMSPEQALGQDVDSRTDIFSLGVVLYELVTGLQPFKGNSDAAVYDAILNRAPTSVTSSNPALPTELNRIISRALEKDRELRYQTASDLRAELKRLERDSGSGQVTIANKEETETAQPASSAEYLVTGIKRHKRSALLAFGLVLVLIAASYLWLRPRVSIKETSPSIENATFTQLTDQPGPEFFPSLAPDGNSFVYASRASGNWDIYLQRVNGKNSTDLTRESLADDTQPAFAPDGEHIAFRSERDGGGIFVMGATGESPKRLTDFGYNPAWSPDGKEIVCSADQFVDPNNRTIVPSPLWAVKIATGEKRLITKGDAAQPTWSPHAERIAYWGVHKGGQRDIWTIPASGGDPVAVTDDPPVDWNPVWSPDGKYLYFASDRGGSMNLWRLPIEESSGKALGPPERITTPSAYSGFISLSRAGQRLAYVQVITHNNLQQIGFDPERERVVGAANWITQGSKVATNPDLSPDGEWFVFDAVGDKQEDLFIIKRDGTGLRQLTNDAYKDRAPFWSPDGKRIVFFSDRSGKYEGWIINPDGSGLRQFTYTTGRGAQLNIWSPDGKRILCNLQFGAPVILESDKTWQEQTPQTLALENDSNQWFMAYSWSPDGQKLAGMLRGAESLTSDIVSNSLASQRFEQLVNFGERPNWLSDSRRLLFSHDDKIYLLDSQSKKFHQILSVTPNRLQAVGLSRDNRLIYYSLTSTDADVWLMTWK